MDYMDVFLLLSASILQDFPYSAVSHFISSFSSYHYLGMRDEMMQTRALAGIAMRQTVMAGNFLC
jgi:hypothetical protein